MDHNIFENSDRKMSDLELIKKTWRFIKPFLPQLILALGLMLILIAVDVINPLITQMILQELDLTKHAVIDITKVLIISISYFVLILFNSLLIYFNTMLLQRVGQSAIYNLRMIVFDHIDSLSLNQLNNIPVGSLVTRVTSDTNALCDLFTNTIIIYYFSKKSKVLSIFSLNFHIF